MAEIMACGVGLPVDNQQQVVSVTDRVMGSQVWYNVERSRKPQTFPQVWHLQTSQEHVQAWQCHCIPTISQDMCISGH